MKKIVYIFIMFISFFILSTNSFANTINSINMEIYIDNVGDAHVKEIWDTYLDRGTEGYRSFSNLDNSQIKDFTVTDNKSENMYEYIDYWDTDESFLYKKNKNGINYTSNGIELCWGISKYGDMKYTLNYTITNFVKTYSDGVQGIYFNLLNLDQDVGKVDILIKSDIPFSLDNARIWSFGFLGTIDFVDGAIKISSDIPVTRSHYVVALVRFESNLFETSVNVSRSFDDEYDSAFNGISQSKENKNGIKEFFKSDLWKYIFTIVKNIFFPVIILIILLRKKPFSMYRQNYKNMKDVTNDQLESLENIDYFKEIPCGGDIPLAYWVCYQYGLVEDNDLRKGIIGAYFTKWIYEEKIKMIPHGKNYDKYSMDISKLGMSTFDSDIESSLANFLIKAGNGNYIVRNKDFCKWSKENFHSFDFWYSRMFSVVKQQLADKGFLYSSEPSADATGINNKNYFNIRKIEVDSVSEEVNTYAYQLNGLKKFMLDFGNVAEKEFFEVHTFKDYIVFACLLGIADKVEGQFKKLYPDYFARYEYDYSAILSLSVNVFKYYSKGHDDYARYHSTIQEDSSIFGKSGSSSHDYSGTSRTSGGGGRSFTGGGKSSGGSSGGGFR